MHPLHEVEFGRDRSSHPTHLVTDFCCDTEHPTEIRKPESARKGSILLVDDDEDQLDLFRLLFARLNYPIVTASSAKEALRIAETTLLEIVISDIRMPQMSGYELVSKIRLDPKLSDVPVILMTSAKEIQEDEVAYLSDDVELFCLKSNFQLLMGQVDFLLG